MPCLASRTCLAALLVSPACCVASTTRVRTPRGEVAAGALVVGDVVEAVDVTTGELRPATVVLVRRAVRECLALRWADGALVCTPDHPIYSPETGGYRPASDWVSGTARTLLRIGPEGAREVAVIATEVFAGVHEVIDIGVDVELHNFVAGGVVVHNKSALRYAAKGEVEGPTIALGGMEEVRFRVHVCVDGGDEAVGVGMDVMSRSTVPPTTSIAFEWTVAIDGVDSGGGVVPAQESVGGGDDAARQCTDGIPVAFRRSDEGPDGEIELSWVARSSFGSFLDEDEANSHEVVLTIEPEE